mgnify:CR=1 FL=1
MYVSVANRLLAYADFRQLKVKCELDDDAAHGVATTTRCTVDDDPPSDAFEHARYACRKHKTGEWICDDDAKLRIGERVTLDGGGDAYVRGIEEDTKTYSLVTTPEHTVIESRIGTLRRPIYPPFASITPSGTIDIPLLKTLPSALVLLRGSKLHFCCHGCIDPAIQAPVVAAGGLVSLFADPGDPGDPKKRKKYLYESSASYTTDATHAQADMLSYNSHRLKWGDMTVDATKRGQSGGRPMLSLDELTDCADRLGLDVDHALISGHQDLVNIGAVGPSDASPLFVNAFDLPSEHPYHGQMHVFNSDATTVPIPYRFVCTSSAVYSKKSSVDDPADSTLSKNSWLVLDRNGLTAHLTPPKPATPPDFRLETYEIDDLSFWGIVRYILDNVRYPAYERNGMRPRRNQTDQTRLFSLTMVNSVFGAAAQTYASDIPPHSICYELLQTSENARICILGDLHSCIDSLAKMLTWCAQEGFFEDGGSIRLRPDRYLIFLGDLVDRGPFGIDILVIVMMLKVANEKQVILIDGNHETHPIYNKDGLSDEVRTEYGDYLTESR